MERIIINGFFAKGNCGDEAILQTWYDMLSPHYRIVASLDADVIKDSEYKSSDLYTKIDIIQNRRVDIFCRDDIKAYIIGGGGLGLGFGIEQWLHASVRNKKLFYLGTIVHEEFLIGNDLMQQINKNFFKSFDYIMVRDIISKENLKESFEVESDCYPDVAFALNPEKVEIKLPEKYITITIRDNGENDIKNIKKWLVNIKKFAKENNYKIIYLPFDKTDKILMESLNIKIKNEFQQIYWHPKKVKYIISKSEMVFSLGRFHPLVFAISSGITCYYIQISGADYSWRYKSNPQDKCYNILNDWGLSEHYLKNENINQQFIKNDKMELISIECSKQISEFFDKLKKKLQN